MLDCWKIREMSNSKKSDDGKSREPVVCRNRRARHQYEILDSIEAGIVLAGSEVKSLRAGHASIEEAYARVEGRDVWLIDCDIPELPQASRFNHKPKRPRKLLLHRREVEKFAGEAKQRGCTLIPLKLYFRRGFARIELALARGRKLHDKREVLRKADATKEMKRAMGRRR
jgi:SsrA-binding protein